MAAYPDYPFRWLGSSLDDLRAFPEQARRIAGYQLSRVRQGLMPNGWKSMKAVGSGVFEIRIHTGAEHRVFYVAKYDDAIYVLHAFEKHTRQTRWADIALARQRLAELFELRRKKQGVFMAIKIRQSTGNVFRDLGFPPEAAENLKVRTDLMIQID
jgi:phage-related protein